MFRHMIHGVFFVLLLWADRISGAKVGQTLVGNDKERKEM